jgi:hypothetical protein
MMPSLIQMFAFFGVFARQALGSGPTSIFINKVSRAILAIERGELLRAGCFH